MATGCPVVVVVTVTVPFSRDFDDPFSDPMPRMAMTFNPDLKIERLPGKSMTKHVLPITCG